MHHVVDTKANNHNYCDRLRNAQLPSLQHHQAHFARNDSDDGRSRIQRHNPILRAQHQTHQRQRHRNGDSLQRGNNKGTLSRHPRPRKRRSLKRLIHAIRCHRIELAHNIFPQLKDRRLVVEKVSIRNFKLNEREFQLIVDVTDLSRGQRRESLVLGRPVSDHLSKLLFLRGFIGSIEYEWKLQAEFQFAVVFESIHPTIKVIDTVV
mmetsp:Transcript_35842/g.57618  ORF Transcript_35842/g.57618 Transcript_35842/m.57618 type:complete len:207 (-) Transcript_35842:478-1098(-)